MTADTVLYVRLPTDKSFAPKKGCINSKRPIPILGALPAVLERRMPSIP